jgi:uncharacterized membrane protein YhhN
MTKILRIVFILICIGDLVGVITNNELLRHCCKPFITVSLILYYWVSAKEHRSVWVVLGLVCCFFGDSFLLYDHLKELYFMLGLGAFLAGHLLYIIAFTKHQEGNSSSLQNIQKMRIAVPIVLVGVLLLIILQPSLGNLAIPVYGYAVVLVTMALSALLRLGRTNSKSFQLAFFGGCLFLLSDSILALNKFHQEFPWAGVMVMITYIVAQYGIIEGFIKHYKTN